MKGINITGIAGCYTPGTKYKDGTFLANVFLMDGPMPSEELLTTLETEADFVALYGANVVHKFNSLNMTTTFDFTTQERHYKKTPIDALDFTNDKTGEIQWAVISFIGESGVSTDGLLFDDSVGTWDEHTASYTVKDKTVVSGEDNILKDINFTIRDKSTYEINPLGITV